MAYGDLINNIPKTLCDLLKRDYRHSFWQLRSRGYIPSGLRVEEYDHSKRESRDVHRGCLVALISNVRQFRGFRGIM